MENCMQIECEQRLTRLEESGKSAHHRIDAMAQEQGEIRQLALAVNSLASSVEQMQKSQENVANRVAEMELKPSKRWDTLTLAIISGIVMTVIGILIGKLI